MLGVWRPYLLCTSVNNWASSWDCGTYRIGDNRRLRRACASVQSRQSLCCSHTWTMEVDEGSDQKSDIKPHWMAAHAYLRNEFTEDKKCQNLIIWLTLYMFNCQWHSYLCNWGPYVRLSYMPNMLYPWNKVVVVIIIINNVMRTNIGFVFKTVDDEEPFLTISKLNQNF